MRAIDFYTANLRAAETGMANDNLTKEQKFNLGYTEARINDLKRCIAEEQKKGCTTIL